MKNIPPFTICKNKHEAENVLDSVYVNDVSLLDFIEATISNETNAKKLHTSFNIEKTILINNEELILQSLLCSAIECGNITETFWPDLSFFYNHILQPKIWSEVPLKECDILGWTVSHYNHILKTPLNTKLSIATIYKFPFEFARSYIINTHYDIGKVYHDDRGHPDYHEEFIVNISHKNYLATIQLE